MCSWSGDLGVGDIHLPPPSPPRPSFHGSAPLHPTGFTVPTYISCREGGNPPLLRLVLCSSLTLRSILLRPSVLFPSRFLSVAGVVRTRPRLLSSSALANGMRGRERGVEARRTVAESGRGRERETEKRRAEPRNEPSRRKHKLNPTRDSSGPP